MMILKALEIIAGLWVVFAVGKMKIVNLVISMELKTFFLKKMIIIFNHPLVVN
jgi:hypothetical protein